MQQHHSCDFGSMQESGTIYKTHNALNFVWPSAPFGCCVAHQLSVSNCYLLSTTIHSRHGSPTPESAVGDVRHCSYKDGHCVLSDGSILMCTPNTEEACEFVAVSKMRGHLLGHVWISDSREFALSWQDDSPPFTDCGHDLTITDQGYALTKMRRAPRSTRPEVGIVTSNQLAAQLLAVEDQIQEAATALFHHALSALCHRTNLLALPSSSSPF